VLPPSRGHADPLSHASPPRAILASRGGNQRKRPPQPQPSPTPARPADASDRGAAPHDAAGGGAPEDERGDDLDLMYDPMFNCYYDPKTNKYYELA